MTDSGDDAAAPLAAIERIFIDSWAALARAFGMDPKLGQAHAFAYLRSEPVSTPEIARELGLPLEQARACLDELAALGVLAPQAGDRYLADPDPWSWFLGTLKHRGREEFSPLVAALRGANREAQRLRDRGALRETQAHARTRIERIERFTQFIDQVAGLLETFASVGAGPLMSALRVAARLRPRR